jgi:RNA polymerase sigma-70 factor, ECF subfamily
MNAGMDPTLDETLAAAGRGDQNAWRRLVDTYSGRVYGLMLRHCGDADLAEEITQATFVTVVTKLGDYRESGRFEAWLFRIATNRLRDEMRRRIRQARPTDFTATPAEAIGYAADASTPQDPLMTAERNQALHRALAELPEPDRQLLYLRYTAELSFAQIAQTLSEPLGTVLARGHRALKKLKDKLAASQE